MDDRINLAEKLALPDKPYGPGIVGYINDYKLQEETEVLLIEPEGTVNTAAWRSRGSGC